MSAKRAVQRRRLAGVIATALVGILVASSLSVSDVPDATAADGVGWVQQLCNNLQVPALGAYGLTEEDFPDLIEKSKRASSMKGNPIKLTDEELEEILKQAV